MKIFVPLVLAATTVSSVNGANEYVNFVSLLTSIKNTDSYHMKPVHVLHARAQSDAPLWNDTTKAFGSKYYSTAEGQFRGALDTVNTASVEGALMYVQAEGIDYRTRSDENKCWRKNSMKYIVFYDIVFTQTNETLSKYETEYGPMLPMDGGQCTPTSGTDVFSTECISLNGNASVSEIGPFVGGGLKDSDVRAPYPNCWWYSFPNSCPLSKWAQKTDACRAGTRQGLCDFGVLPDGITCTYNYRILGYVPIDDVVGITTMKNKAYTDFAAFCKAGEVEFKTDNATGALIESIPFWANPLDKTANAARAQKLVDAYAAQLTAGTSSQISSADIVRMRALPTTSSLTTANPPCYENIKECAEATYGCKRDLYSQLCTKCTATGTGCVAAPSNFTFLLVTSTERTLSESASTGSSGSGSSPSRETSGAATFAMTVGALVASFGISLMMG